MAKNHHQVQVLISGRVQGVFFRQKTLAMAKRLGIIGWIRNEEDGRVKILAEGEKEKIEKFLEWARRGPRFARVDSVEIEWRKPEGFSDFEIRY